MLVALGGEVVEPCAGSGATVVVGLPPAAMAAVEVAGLVWKFASSAMAPPVAARTGIARRISVSSVREAFEVDAATGDSQGGEPAPDGVDHGRRSTDEDVALRDVGDEARSAGMPSWSVWSSPMSGPIRAWSCTPRRSASAPSSLRKATSRSDAAR